MTQEAIQEEQNESYKIILPNFEGPLDLLLYLIRKHKIDIYDIPIAFMLEEYLKYLAVMEDLNISIEGEFMEMAATLIQIKLRSLLPRSVEEEEEDPRTELVNNLLAYQKVKETTGILSELADENRYYVYRSMDDEVRKEIQQSAVTYELEQKDVDLYDLIKVLQKYIILKPQEIAEDISLDEYKVEVKIEDLAKLMRRQKKILFSDLVKNCGRTEIIAFFLAVLEMIKRKRITVFQSNEFSDIHINRPKD
ncbi:MAG: segregation/condensation protein A [Candidatus Cloacimonetes bacterium]|nr:segregation/condensation protein A [Candidatus Cloacimonadota bacterium]